LDSSATGTGEAIRKETDTHMGSKDGNGVFNFRIKLPLFVPCSFPRLTFYVYDMQSFGSDEAIGECVMSLKKVMKKLREEGRYELLP
jgi:hypothetical protein